MAPRGGKGGSSSSGSSSSSSSSPSSSYNQCSYNNAFSDGFTRGVIASDAAFLIAFSVVFFMHLGVAGSAKIRKQHGSKIDGFWWWILAITFIILSFVHDIIFTVLAECGILYDIDVRFKAGIIGIWLFYVGEALIFSVALFPLISKVHKIVGVKQSMISKAVIGFFFFVAVCLYISYLGIATSYYSNYGNGFNDINRSTLRKFPKIMQKLRVAIWGMLLVCSIAATVSLAHVLSAKNKVVQAVDGLTSFLKSWIILTMIALLLYSLEGFLQSAILLSERVLLRGDLALGLAALGYILLISIFISTSFVICRAGRLSPVGAANGSSTPAPMYQQHAQPQQYQQYPGPPPQGQYAPPPPQQYPQQPQPQQTYPHQGHYAPQPYSGTPSPVQQYPQQYPSPQQYQPPHQPPQMHPGQPHVAQQ